MLYRIQPHTKTREQQLLTWCSLVLKYYKHKKLATLNLGEESELFANESLNRKLSNDGKLQVLQELEKTQNATPLDKKKTQWEVYWHTLDEWANLIHTWVVANGQTNTIFTLFDLTNGDSTAGEEFYGLDERVLVKALKVLEARGKCVVFENNEGVKFL